MDFMGWTLIVFDLWHVHTLIEPRRRFMIYPATISIL